MEKEKEPGTVESPEQTTCWADAVDGAPFPTTFASDRKCWADESECLSPEFAPIPLAIDRNNRKSSPPVEATYDDFNLDDLYPPFNAYVGGFAFDIDERMLGSFFTERGCRVLHVRLPRDDPKKGKGNRCKGFGYVEFENAESLQVALRLYGATFKGRKIKVDIADRDSRLAKGSGRASGKKGDIGDPWAPKSSGRSGKAKGNGGKRSGRGESDDWGPSGDVDGNYQGWDDRGRFRVKMKEPEPTRTPLQLQSKTFEGETSPGGTSAPSEPARKKVDPFGGAKPRDEADYERRKAEESKVPHTSSRKESKKESQIIAKKESKREMKEIKYEQVYSTDWVDDGWNGWDAGGWNERERPVSTRGKGDRGRAKGKKGGGKGARGKRGIDRGAADHDMNWRQ
eukprot:GEMP01047077.1.p1 GENE.GEMP01047077.1~~GEMP01047077.1.p1  ORF type:complete len:398 (+),score=107.61 GEMP01047077.1:198-1391(+)